MPWGFAYIRRHWLATGAAAVLVGAVLVAVLAIAQRDNLFMTIYDPGRPFQVWEPPAAPDYGQDEAWALTADLEEDPEALEAAVFFIHPTTYPGGGNYNAPVEKELSRRRLERVMLPNYAAPFAAAGPVFAPYYRQASLYSLLTNRDDARRARAFAYRDVARAFTEFLDRIGEDRAFVLAGVGQGGLHAAGLLRDRIAADEDLRDRMIAAYVIDYPLPLDMFESALAPLPPCAGAEDFRCVVAWASVDSDDQRRMRYLTETLMQWDGGALESVTGRELLCVNPLLWNASEDFAPARLNRGAVAAEGLEPGVTPSPAPGQTSAQCQDGLLLIEKARSRRFHRPLALAERYRVAPYNLFYEDIRENLETRSTTALAVMTEEARYADPIEETVVIGESPVNAVPD